MARTPAWLLAAALAAALGQGGKDARAQPAPTQSTAAHASGSSTVDFSTAAQPTPPVATSAPPYDAPPPATMTTQYPTPAQQPQPYAPSAMPTYAIGSPPTARSGATPLETPAPEWHASRPGVILSIERMFGLYFSSGRRGGGPATGSSPAGPDTDLSGSSVNILGGSPMGTFNPFSTPFASVHGVVGPGITFGGGIGYQGDDQEMKDMQTVDLSAFVVAPRVGFIQEISKVVSVWLRGGVTYSSQKVVTTQAACPPFSTCGPPPTQTFSMLDLSVDPMFVFTPFPHLGILLGPTVDVALAGTETFEPITTSTDPNSPAITPEREFRLSSFGAAAGIALFF